MKILISCYACSPYRGSEPGMGWNFISHIAKHHELWVLTEKEKWEPDIQRFMAEHPKELQNIHFIFIQKPRARLLRKIWPPSYYWFYRIWQWKAYHVSKKLHAAIHFDAVHQLNMVTFREPGYLWKLPIPFVWGPIGGFGITPWCMFPALGFRGMIHYVGRNVLNMVHAYGLIRPRLAARRAGGCLMVATSENKRWAKRVWGVESDVVCEVGLTFFENFGSFASRSPDEPLRIVWSGQHESRKALPLLLDALAHLPEHVEYTLAVLGEGDETLRWRQYAETLHIAQAICWHGWISKEKSLEIMQAGHLFVITSVWDLTSTVLLEALSFGLPVICLDHLGFADVISPACGIPIQVSTPKGVSDEIARAIETLYCDEPKRQALAAGAFRRARDFSWEKKIEVVLELYRRATNKICEQA